MRKKTNAIPYKQQRGPAIDDTDRRLLGLLAEDAGRSYADLGKTLNLSAPAVHARTQRLKREQVIVSTVAKIDGTKIGRPLLTFIHVMTGSWKEVTDASAVLVNFPEIEEIHAVTGDTSLILKVRTSDTNGLASLLNRLQKLEGFHNTRSHVVLSTYLERGPSPLPSA